MELFLVIAQGIGLAAACGIRPFLPALLAGALASLDRGVDFGGTAFAFLERMPFLVAVALALIALTVLERRRRGPGLQVGALAAAVAGVAIGVGALEFGGSLADEGHPPWAGLAGGLACAALAQAAARQFFGRVSARLDPDARSALVVYLEGLSLLLAAAAVLLPPLSLLALVVFVVVLVRGRRREGQKYAGLRVLR